jgi:GTP-binding protein
MADVALVGFPNAGKSTLISRISAAKPKIANYPFTTLEPHLGVVRVDDAEYIVADIPGLIEGASEGKGLGHQFLRHVERARALCVLLDLAPMDGTTPERQLEVLLNELGNYKPELLERPRIVLGTKVDAAEFPWDDGPTISAVTGAGINQIKGQLATLVTEARGLEPVGESVVVLRPEPKGTWVERLGEHEFRVHGRSAERSVALNDVSTPNALNFIDERLSKLGVPRLLARAGAEEGDVVHIATFSFAYVPEV